MILISRFVAPCSSVFSSLVAAIALTLTQPILADPPDTGSKGAVAAPIPFSELGAKATADYHGDAIGITANADGAELRTRFQQLSSLATKEGLWLQSTEKEGGRLRLIANALGRDNKAGSSTPLLTPLPTAGTVGVGEKVVTFARPGLTEEYSVSVDGLRQDFVIAERPPGVGDVYVELALTGARAAVATSGVKLTMESSLRELAYTRLRVVDATGRELVAKLEVLTSDRLGIRVADDAAVYPIRIDPTFSDADWVSMNPGIPGANSIVLSAVADMRGTLYIGGEFTWVGTIPARQIAKWDGSTWSAVGEGVQGHVTKLAVNGNDLYVGGAFNAVGGVPANNIAKWDGVAWSTLGDGLTGGYVRALAVSGNDLYVGGTFTTAGAEPANHLAKWNGTSWSVPGGGVDGPVSALATREGGSDLYVGGYFSKAGNVNASNIAKWNGTTWSALDTGVDSFVSALAISGNDLYVGGGFYRAGSVQSYNVAKWNGTSWSGLGGGVASGEVHALAVSGTDLYVGGRFTWAGGVSANAIAKWNGTSWSALAESVNGTVETLVMIGSDLHVGGSFSQAGTHPASGLAKWNGTSWSGHGDGMNSVVYALGMSSNALYVGGLFNTAGSIRANNIVKWDGSSWSALGEGLNNGVTAVLVRGGGVFAGGYFTVAGTRDAYGIAKWNGIGWSPLGQGVLGFVYAMEQIGNDLYVGGSFSSAGSVFAQNIAKWNGSSWARLGEGVNGAVNTLAVRGGELYAGGSFTMAGDGPANYIAKWNGTSWSTVGQGMNGPVQALLQNGDGIIAGGAFTAAGNSPANHIAKWNGASWSTLGDGVNGNVHALAVGGDGVYAGGEFTAAGTRPANHIAKWNGFFWAPLAEGVDGPVDALATDYANHLFVGGGFYFAGTHLSPFIARANLVQDSPNIAVTSGVIPIANGDISPSLEDQTDFGTSVITDGPVSRTFTLFNLGGAALTIRAIDISDPDTTPFSISGLTFPSRIEPLGRRDFTVTFSPVTHGTFQTVLSIVNDAPNGRLYRFSIQGTRLNSAPVARDDSFSVRAGTPVAIPITALLANDLDPDGTRPFVVNFGPLTSPGHPDIEVIRDRITLKLTAPSDDVSEATFTYRISDGTLSTSATVHLHVEPRPLVYEGFDYPAGEHLAAPAFTSVEPEKNGGIGWVGPWTTTKSILVFPIANSSLVPPVTGFPVSGGAAVATGSASRLIRPIGIAPGQKLWFSAVLRSAALVVGDVLMDFDFADVGMRFGTYNPTGTLPLGWGLTAYSSSFGGTAVADEPALLVAEIDHTTVSHYDFRLYVNPLPGATPPAPTAAHGLDRFGGYDSLRSVTISDFGATERAGFDEIRIGRSYASVTSPEARGIVGLNEIRGSTTGSPGGFSLQFGAPEAGTYVLRRKLLCTGGDFVDFTTQTVSEPGLITFVDTLDTCGALYQIVRTGP